MLVEQTRGLKMDILKIIRNPSAHLRQGEKDEANFAANETVIKISGAESS